MNAVIVFALIASVQSATAAETIVGRWRIEGQECTPTAGAVAIEPLALNADETRCEFDSVARKGSTITWQGRCAVSDGELERTTVIARERDGRLNFTWNGRQDADFFVRCR